MDDGPSPPPPSPEPFVRLFPLFNELWGLDYSENMENGDGDDEDGGESGGWIGQTHVGPTLPRGMNGQNEGLTWQIGDLSKRFFSHKGPRDMEERDQLLMDAV